MKAILKYKDGTLEELDLTVTNEENKTVATLKKESICGKKCESVIFENSACSVSYKEGGYAFYPVNCHIGYVKTEFMKRGDSIVETQRAAMPVAGICENASAIMLHILGNAYDARFVFENKNNIFTLKVEFILNTDDPYEDMVVSYLSMPYATYSDMARIYRKYQIEVKGCLPIKERIKTNPYLKYALESVEVRVRMGWKPVPTPVMHQNDKNEPPLKVVCDVNTLYKLVDKLQKANVKKAEICLVGWSKGGHDGRFPQIYPTDERFGGDEQLKQFIEYAQNLGYNIVSHTNSECAYEVANNWDINLVTHKRNEDGSIEPMIRMGYYNSGGLSGGAPYHLCPKTAYEHYGINDLPHVQELGFKGIHFIDELTICSPQKCYHPDHPTTTKDTVEYYRKLAKLSNKLFGGFQSEGWFDFINADTDYIMYTYTSVFKLKRISELLDERIPFWQLVYHGIVLSNTSADTVNYVIKDTNDKLKLIEYGGRPLMYIHSKFGDEKNWMGDLDLRCTTEAELNDSVEAIRIANEEYEKLSYLQYEFMDEHTKLADGIYKTVYSNGTVVITDYNKGEYCIEDQ